MTPNVNKTNKWSQKQANKQTQRVYRPTISETLQVYRHRKFTQHKTYKQNKHDKLAYRHDTCLDTASLQTPDVYNNKAKQNKIVTIQTCYVYKKRNLQTHQVYKHN